jgi:predicted GTPase
MTRATASLLLVDCRDGLTATDNDIASWLRRQYSGHVIVIAAKCDSYGDATLLCAVHEASALGLGDAIPYSAETKAGTVELYDALRPLVDRHHFRDVPEYSGAASSAAGVCPRGALQLKGRGTAVPSVASRSSDINGGGKRLDKHNSPKFGGWSPIQEETGSTSEASRVSPAQLVPHNVSKVTGQLVLLNTLPVKSETDVPHGKPHYQEVDTAESPLPQRTKCSSSSSAGGGRDTELSKNMAMSSASLDEDMESVRDREAATFGSASALGNCSIRDKVDVLGKGAPIKLAIVGLPNTGKSTLLNTLIGYERAVTGPEPGLTRDAVTCSFSWSGLRFEAADTAGWVRDGALHNYDEVGGKVAGLTVLQVCMYLDQTASSMSC